MKLLLLFFIYTNCILLKQNIGDLTHSLRQLKKKFAFQNETIANLTKQIQLENNIQNEMLKLNKTKDSTKKETIIKRNLVDEYNEQQFPFEKIPLKFWPSSNTHITEYSFYQNMIFELKRKKDLEKISKSFFFCNTLFTISQIYSSLKTALPNKNYKD